MDFSVGDFAEQLIAQERNKGTGGTTPPTFEPDTSIYSPEMGAQAPDISEVVVPNDFVNSIVENKEIVAEQPQEVREVAATKPVESLGEVAEIRSLVSELKELIAEVKQTLTEMTTVGMGIGAPAPAPAPKQDKKGEEEEDDLKKLLRKIKNKRSKA